MNRRQHSGKFYLQGQSIIEYILLMAAVILALLLFFSRSGVFHRSYNNVLRIQAETMENSAATIFDL